MSNKLPQSTSKRSLIPKAEYYPLAFKCFDMENKKMLLPDEVMAQGVFATPTGHFVSADGKQRPYRRLCFTGLKDNKGIPLFEGDICKITISVDLGIGFPSLMEKWAVMRWVKDGFSFIMPEMMGQTNTSYQVMQSSYEGNEWETPELLDNLLPNE